MSDQTMQQIRDRVLASLHAVHPRDPLGRVWQALLPILDEIEDLRERLRQRDLALNGPADTVDLRPAPRAAMLVIRIYDEEPPLDAIALRTRRVKMRWSPAVVSQVLAWVGQKRRTEVLALPGAIRAVEIPPEMLADDRVYAAWEGYQFAENSRREAGKEGFNAP